MADVTLRKVVKRYDEVEAVRGIDLDIADHEFVVLVGPSGCGKSTTLRMIAGLEDISDGDIMIGGDVINDVPPKDRDIAMVFQSLPRPSSPSRCHGHPLVFTTSVDQLVLPVGIITTLIKGDVFAWGQIMTGALLGAAPPLIIYAFLMDYYIAGLTAGATKGLISWLT